MVNKMYLVLYRWIAISIHYQSPVLIFTRNGDLITPNHFHGSTLAKFAPTNFWLTKVITRSSTYEPLANRRTAR